MGNELFVLVEAFALHLDAAAGPSCPMVGLCSPLHEGEEWPRVPPHPVFSASLPGEGTTCLSTGPATHSYESGIETSHGQRCYTLSSTNFVAGLAFLEQPVLFMA